MIELQNIRANDELFVNEGIEEEQLQAAFEQHDIKNDEEFKGKVTKLQADFNTQMQAQMQQMNQMQQ
jgi:hypothetical protein